MRIDRLGDGPYHRGMAGMIRIAVLCLALIGAALTPAFAPAHAQETGSKTGLPLPRFVSLNKSTVYLRAGPSTRYPIRWVYERLHLPVEVIGEYDNWRKIRDMDGDEGWIHRALLTGKRHVVIRGREVIVRNKPIENAAPVAIFEEGVIAEVHSCGAAWCEIEAHGHKGHAERALLWGLYADERLED